MARSRAQDKRPTVERSVRFYRIDAGQDEAGNRVEFDPRASLEVIQQIKTVGGRYLVRVDGTILCCWVEALNAPQRARFATIRRSGLPEVEENGSLQPLVIPPTSGLAEHVHLLFFPGRVLGADFNFYGPRPSSFATYHNDKTDGQFGSISIDPLLRPDVSSRLDRLQDIRMFKLKVRRPYADTVRQANQSLGRALRAAAEAGEASEVEITLTPTAYSRGHIGSGLLATARSLVRRSDFTGENVRAFVVKGLDPETGSVEEIDLLRSHLLTMKQIVRLDDRTRALDPDSAYSAILEAYQELRADLEGAAGIHLG